MANHRKPKQDNITLADILRNVFDDVLKANGLPRRKSEQTQAEPRKMAHASRKAKGPSEHDEQVRLFQMVESYPALSCLFAIPNGGYRTKATAGKLKAEGVKSGVPDLFLPVASRPNKDGKAFHGMFLEMKIPGNKPTDNQREWLQKLANNGYYCVVCYGADAALE